MPKTSDKIKILFLTQYFPPEVGAPQNRLFEIAARLQQHGAEVTVLTAMPNYPQMEIQKDYKGRFFVKEKIDEMKIYRSSIFVSKKKSIFFRLLNYFSFVFSSMFTGIFRINKQDYIFCESPPLFLGISAMWICFFKRSKLIFNVSDLWPESAEKLGLVTNKFALKLATGLEKRLYKKSILVSGQTQGILKNISERFPQKKTYWLPNGVDLALYDSEKVESNWRNENGFSQNDFILFYGGIIGYAQGLDIVLLTAAKLKEFPEIKFILQGSGPEKGRLLKIKDEKSLENVFFFNAVAKDKMPLIVKAIDVALIPLRKLDLFKGAIPSKIFENLAMKKAILLGVEGEAKELFIDEAKAGYAFEPENVEDLTEKVRKMYENRRNLSIFGENGYNYVKNHFNRDKIAADFWNKIKELRDFKLNVS